MLAKNNAFDATLKKLKRYPDKNNKNLRAWDAADEYLLHELFNNISLKSKEPLLIFNDSFGALTTNLAEFKLSVMTDSYISQQGIKQNLKQLGDNYTQSIEFLSSLDKHKQCYDLVIIKIPKSIDYLSYFLASLKPFITESTTIIAAGMVKYMPKSIWQLFNEALGETQTLLAKKKAKLIYVKNQNKAYSCEYPSSFSLEDSSYKIFNHANIFSKKSLDIGTRFLLQNIPAFQNIKSAVDLGCGNGVVGLKLSTLYPKAHITFSDESYMAVESARLTLEHNRSEASKHDFIVQNCLDTLTDKHFNLIVCNPPFHQNQSVGLHIALQMFQQSYEKLADKGHLLVIANRHLPYYSHLKKIFKRVDIIASNRKFTLYQMQKNIQKQIPIQK